MHSFMLRGFHVCCIVVFFAALCNAAGASKQPKRLSNNQGLIPFPRIGRGGSGTWDSGMDKYNERVSLFAFPRVGRNDPNANDKDLAGAMWFGPRLGRIQKRDIILYDLPHDYPREIIFRGGVPEVKQMQYASRLPRDSEEVIDAEQQQSEP